MSRHPIALRAPATKLFPIAPLRYDIANRTSLSGGGATVEDWLTAIGLAERIGAFHAHRITLDQFGDLTDDDLRELGLTIGERKRFRRAVAAMRPAAPDDPPLAALPVLETTRAERRPLTIMFVDLVNSSSLGERLEPEDLQSLEGIVEHPERFAAGSHLFNFGDPLRAIYVVRAGDFKIYRSETWGRERVLGFSLTGG